jgi:hypothetical protein
MENAVLSKTIFLTGWSFIYSEVHNENVCVASMTQTSV